MAAGFGGEGPLSLHGSLARLHLLSGCAGRTSPRTAAIPADIQILRGGNNITSKVGSERAGRAVPISGARGENNRLAWTCETSSELEDTIARTPVRQATNCRCRLWLPPAMAAAPTASNSTATLAPAAATTLLVDTVASVSSGSTTVAIALAKADRTAAVQGASQTGLEPNGRRERGRPRLTERGRRDALGLGPGVFNAAADTTDASATATTAAAATAAAAATS